MSTPVPDLPPESITQDAGARGNAEPSTHRGRSLLQHRHAGRAALLLAIDFRECALQKASDGVPLLSHALRVAAGVMKDKIISRARDLVGVVAFGCKITKNKLHLENIAVLKSLDVPNASAIVKLQQLADLIENRERSKVKKEEDILDDGGNEIESGESDLGHMPDGPFAMKNLIWVFRNMFAMSKVGASRDGYDLTSRRAILFSNDADPSRGDDEITRLAVTQAKDLNDTGAVLDLMLMTNSEESVGKTREGLEKTQFYRQVFAQQEEDKTLDGSIYVCAASSLKDMSAKVRRKVQTKRAHASGTLNLGNGLRIGIKVYAMVRKTTKPAATPLAVSTNLPALRKSSVICRQTALPLKEEQVRYGYKIGETFAAFTKKEVDSLKRLANRGLTLYGYVNQAKLRVEEVLGPPLFVYPDDSKLAGSSALFASLHKKLLQKHLMALVLANLRAKSESRFAYLVPQEEEKDSEGMQVKPPGFLLVYLPYKNDVYDQWRVELEKAEETSKVHGGLETEIEPPSADTEDLDEEDRRVPRGSLAAKEMVRKLLLPKFDPADYYNPDIQAHYAVLQAVALGDEHIGLAKDYLEPDEKRMEKVAGEAMEKFKAMTLGADFDGAEIASTHAKKRGSAADDAEKVKRAAKRKAETDLKAESAMEDLDLNEFRELNAHDEMEKLTVKKLKQYCEAFCLKTSGRKNALIARVQLHLSEH